MSKTIDHRIVEMRFDNKQFEAGAKETMGTLGRLKEALKLPNTVKAFEKIDDAAKNISLDGIASGVEALEKRFSTLGIVGMRVIENITDGLMNKLHAAISFVTDSIVSGGIKRAMNIENAHFQLQALLKDEKKVQAVMADAMESVDGTAYAYDEAAKAASQFAASGIQAGDEMLNALRGITGVAAMTNSSFEDISRVFTTVAGNGRLMGDQLLQLSSRGLNAASTLSDYFREVRGQSNMTESAIREMVSKGKISFKDFSDAMTWAFGDSAKRANETFTGSLSNMKSALARIGAEFVAPLIEQNSELVQLFNALRIKINDVKSALTFNESRSAISGLSEESELLFDNLSGVVKDGSIGFDEVTNSILTVSTAEEELASANEKLAKTYEEIKEAGFASSQALIDFNKNGINAAKAVREYVNGVLDGTIKVSDEARESIENLTGGVKLNAGEVMQLAEQGRISYDIFTDAIVYSSGIVDRESKLTSDAITKMMNAVKENGAVTVDNLIEFNKNGMNAAKALREYINGVLDGSIRASYSTKKTIEEITGGTKVLADDILRLAEEGKISFDIFQSAMEEAYGNEKTLSKQFTDFFLDHIKMLVIAVNELDMTKPMEIFYYWVESIKNVVKGLYSILKPFGIAFKDVFINFSIDDVITFSAAIEKLTSKMKLSEKGSNNLHDAVKGLLSVGKLLLDLAIGLLKAIIPINEPIIEMGDGFLELAGSSGRLLTKFTEIIRSSTLLRKSFSAFSSGISIGVKALTKLIKVGKNFVSAISELEGTRKLIEALNNAFKKLSNKAEPYIDSFIEKITKFSGSLFNLDKINLDTVLSKVSEAFSDLAWEIEHFSIKNMLDSLTTLKNKIKDLLMSNEGFATFVTNFSNFGKELKEAFTLDNLLDRVEKVMDVFGKFFNWIKNVMGPSFKDFNIGSVLAAGGGLGIIYSMIKAAKSFENISKTLGSIPSLMGSIKGTLVAYQKDLKASALLKVAGAIAILAGALVLLSFTDTDRLLEASLALSLIAGVLLLGVSKLLDSINKGKEVSNALSIFAKGLSKTMKKFGRAIEIKAIGSAMKDFATSIAIIAVSVIALGIMYDKNPKAFGSALLTIAAIGLVIGAIIGLMLYSTKFKNASKIEGLTKSMLMISVSLGLIIFSITKLMKMKLPDDYGIKLGILAGIFVALGLLMVTMAGTARLSGKNKLPEMQKTIKSLAILLVATVLSLKVLFDMKLPDDYGIKLGILAGIFVALGLLMVTIAAVSRLSKGKGFKAAGTILAMAAFIGVIVGALFVLTILPSDKMLKGAVGLGLILVALGGALYGAGKISKKDTYKSVLAMALTVGVITASLAVLSMIPLPKLAKSVVALSVILLTLAKTFDSLAKVKSKNALPAILGMVAAVLTITIALSALTNQPWAGLLAAATAISVTLLAFSKSFEGILSKKWSKNNVKKIGTFLLLTLAIIPIGIALKELSNQPWEGLLAAAASISMTVLAFSKSFDMILSKNWSNNNVKKIGTFLLLTLAIIPIGIALGVLANQPWAGLLAAAASLSVTLLAMSTAFIMISKTKVDPKAIVSFVAAAGAACLVAIPLGILANQPVDGLLAASISLSAILLAISGCLAILTAVNANVATASSAALALSAFIGILGAVIVAIGALFSQDIIPLEGWLDKGIEILIKIGEGLGGFVGGIVEGALSQISEALPTIGYNLSLFWEYGSKFFEGIGNLDESTFSKIGQLSGALIALTMAELINAITSFLGTDFGTFGFQLSQFMEAAEPFFLGLNDVKPEGVEASKHIASMILALTASNIISGIAGIFGLSGSLSDFADELVAFGPAIAEFATTVKDVNPESVKGAAAAAEIMATVAGKLQGHGGIIQDILGDKSLATFADELVAFGPAIADFAEMVKDVKPEAVEGAASAAEIMATVAEKLPNQGGLASKILGDNTLSDFGEELVSFGPSILQFANMVKSLNPTSVSGTAIITTIMSNLASNLPDKDTIWNKIFGGGKYSLSEFGDQLVLFGESMSSFSGSIKTVNTSLVANAIQGFTDLVDLALKVEGVSAKDLVDFSKKLSTIGTDSVDKFVSAFANSTTKVSEGIQNLINPVIMEIQNKSEEFSVSGETSANQWISGFRNKYADAGEVGTSLMNSSLNTMKLKLPDFLMTGASSALQYLQAIRNKYTESHTVGKTFANNALSGCQSLYSSFYQAGVNGGQGFIVGLRSQMNAAAAAGAAIGEAAYEAAKKALDEHSPSKKMGEVGENAGLGFINKLMLYTAKAANAGKEIGKAAIDGTETSLQMMDDIGDLVIHPRVDMDDIYSSVKEIEMLFNNAVNNIRTNAIGINTQVRKIKNDRDEDTKDPIKPVSDGVTNYNFNQYNTSPKALSRIDIYRQTKNQFSQFREENRL